MSPPRIASMIPRVSRIEIRPAGVPIDMDIIRQALDRRAGRAYPQPLPEGKGEDKRIVGRHDACIAVRAVAVVEAMAALVLQDIFSV